MRSKILSVQVVLVVSWLILLSDSPPMNWKEFTSLSSRRAVFGHPQTS
ncbi:MAG: hypothetical protein ACE5PV_03070 [Candidatus Poribacteria bacterium]